MKQGETEQVQALNGHDYNYTSVNQSQEVILTQLILQDIKNLNDKGLPYDLSDRQMAERYKCSPIDTYNVVHELASEGVICVKEDYDFSEELDWNDRGVQQRSLWIKPVTWTKGKVDGIDYNLGELVKGVEEHLGFYNDCIQTDNNYRVPDWMQRHKFLNWNDMRLLSLLLLNLQHFKGPIKAFTTRLSSLLYVSERTVYRSLKRLENLNLLLRKRMTYNGINGRFLIPNMKQIKLLMN